MPGKYFTFIPLVYKRPELITGVYLVLDLMCAFCVPLGRVAKYRDNFMASDLLFL